MEDQNYITKFSIIISPENKNYPIISRVYTSDNGKRFSVDITDEDWSASFSSTAKGMIYYAIRGIPAFTVPERSPLTCRYSFEKQELNNFPYESNGVPLK